MTRLMKALVKRHPKVGLWMEEVPFPTLGPEDLLIKIKNTAICGTDLHIFNWDAWAQKTVPVPMVTGHEFFGIVEQVGERVTGYKPGERVSGEGHITCGYCRNCRAGQRHLCRNTQGIGVTRTGVFSEYFVLPASNAFRIPNEIPDEIGAIFDPYGNAVHTALSFNLVGEDVLITGAGPIGIMAAAVARHVGARHVVVSDVNDYRLNLAAQLGASRVVNVKHQSIKDVMRELKMTEGFDVGLEMSGNATAFNQMLDLVNHGGRVALLGIFSEPVAIDWSQVVFKGLHIKGIYGREMYETWYKMAAMLQSGLDISPVITHRFPVDDFEEGFQIMNEGLAGKVILNWDNKKS